jgi:hypothetical protein
MENTSIFPAGLFVDENVEHGDPQLPAFLAEHNVAEALMRANTLHMQRHGAHAVASPRFVSHAGDLGSLSGRFAPFHGEGAPLSAYDFHPSLGHSGHGASTVLPTPRELLQRFLPGQESASVLQLAKRPKPRAKDVAHRRSLVSVEPFHNMDNSFTALTPEQLVTLSRHHSPPFATTATVHRAVENRPDKGGGRLEHSLPQRVEHAQESGLGLAWRPTGPGVFPTGSTPAPVYVGGGGVSPRSSTVSVDYGPFAVVFVLEDGSLLNQPTWPTINVRLLCSQVSDTLGLPADTLFFVCHGVALDLQRRLCDRPVIDGTTPIY